MSDEALLLFGCVVSFIALAGAYVALRVRFLHPEVDSDASEPGESMLPLQPVPVKAVSRRDRVRS